MSGRQLARLVAKLGRTHVLRIIVVCVTIAVAGAGMAVLVSATWAEPARLLAIGIALAFGCVAFALAVVRRGGPASRGSGRRSPAIAPPDWQRVQDLLDEALELPSDERPTFIARASSGDPVLHDEVSSLLEAHARAGVLDRPAADLAGGSFRLAPGSFPSSGRDADRGPIPDRVRDRGMARVGGVPDPRFERLGHYEIIEQIGAGGMGVVYKARDTRLGRTVAIKSLPTLAVTGHDARSRLVREARTAAAINHPNVATTHAVEVFDAAVYLVMELVDGTTLEALSGDRRPDVATCIELVAQTAEGLGAAHALGIVHRDIKPSNVLVTADGRVKITDFGIARQTTGTQHNAGTEGVLGTPAYMSPEQADGQPAGAESDVWSLGVVLFTLLTGETPWGRGASPGRPPILPTDPPFDRLPNGLPPAITTVVRKAMAWDPAERFRSGSEFAATLRTLQRATTGSTAPVAPWTRHRRILTAFAAFAVIVPAAVYFQRQSRVRWARAEAMPAISELLANRRFLDAWLLVQEAEKYLGDDPRLRQFERTAAMPRTILSDPEGARVFVRDYLSEAEEWHFLGETPLRDAFVPAGNLRWEVRRAGYRTAVGAFHVFLADTFRFELTPETESRDMLFVEAGTYQRGGGVLGGRAAPIRLDGFWLDRTEVTNAAYELFVSTGAYGDSTHWSGLPWEGAVGSTWRDLVAGFRDSTGRPGPAAWQLGRHPEGSDEEPVRGVGWYEAAAYCASLGKSLPTYHHWFRAASPGIYSDILLESNFGSSGPATVGAFDGMSRFGHVDMAGNVREWTWTAIGRARYALGGAWSDPAYLFSGSDARLPLDRSLTNGFRCAAYQTPLDPALLAELPRLPPSSAAAVVSDEVFDVFRRLYASDSRPLESTVHSVDTSSPYWNVQLVSFDAGYGDERMLARLYLPKPGAAAPPYQTVIYFPGSDGLTLRSSDGLTAQTHFDFVPRSGRILVFPIYKGTYERYSGVAEPVTGAPTEQFNAWRDQVVQWGRDLRRTVDYLETRDDVDATRLAFLGLSLGGRYAPIFMALEDRLDAALLVAGGFAYADGLPDEVLPIHYAPRVRVPTLMVSGSQDFTRPVETAIRPMFEAFGTPESDKKLVLFPGGHMPPKNDIVRESLDWLDRYLGQVRRVR